MSKTKKVPITVVTPTSTGVSRVIIGHLYRVPKLVDYEGGYGVWEISVLGKKYRTHRKRQISVSSEDAEKLKKLGKDFELGL
jgi:hypothetical protein